MNTDVTAQAMAALRERCKALQKRMDVDAMLGNGDPVETLFSFAKDLISEREYIIGFNAGWEECEAQAAKPDAVEEAVRAEPYLVWSNEHRAWWRPDSAGYTTHLEQAGRYSRDEAISISAGARNGWSPTGEPDEMPIREADALACTKVRLP